MQRTTEDELLELRKRAYKLEVGFQAMRAGYRILFSALSKNGLIDAGFIRKITEAHASDAASDVDGMAEESKLFLKEYQKALLELTPESADDHSDAPKFSIIAGGKIDPHEDD